MSNVKRVGIILAIVLLTFSMMIIPGCGADKSVDHDLTRMSRPLLESTINKMQTTPAAYLNRTYKINGDFNGSTQNPKFIITDNVCCSYELSLTTKNNIKLPTKKGKITIIAKYISRSLGGNTTYALEVSSVL